MKKLFILLGLMLMFMSAWAWDIEVGYPPVCIDGYFYYIKDNGAWLSYGAHRGEPLEPEFWIINEECYSGDVIVPESVNGVPVVGIMNQTFVGCTLTSLQLPNTIKSIGADAFYDCTCPEVRIPGSVETIATGVFSACNFNKLVFEYGTAPLKFTGSPFSNSSVVSELYIDRDYVKDSYVRFSPASLKKVTIGDNMTELSNSMFEYNNTLESITFGSQIKEIPNAICNGCSALKSIYFNNGITHIRQRAFSSCSALPAIIIPEGVTHIDESAFNGCSAAAELSLPSTLKVIRSDAFYGDVNLASVSIPASVDSIGTLAFYGCRIHDFTIEDGINPINLQFYNSYPWCGILDDSPLQRLHLGRKHTGGQTFKFKTLKSVSFGDAVDEINEATFQNCDSLTSITWGNGLKRIGKNAFNNCKALPSISIPEGVTHIDESAFNGCSAAAELSLPSTLKVIRSDAFYGDVNLASVSIPASVDSIGTLAFYGCRIHDFTIEDGINPINLQFYNSYPWCGILDDSPLQRLHLGRKHTGGQTFKFKTLKSVSFGDAVDEINEATFQNCDSLIHITWGKGLKRIGRNAFYNCKALPAIIIPEGVTQIDESAFNGCSAATELSLPSTLTNIGSEAFNRCYSLLKVTCQALTPPQMQNSNIFLNDTYNNGTLYVLNSSIEDYRQADYWYRFSNIAAALIPGDVDGDGQVGIADVTALIDYILGNSDPSFIVDNADVDGDGNIGIADVTAIIDTLLGN